MAQDYAPLMEQVAMKIMGDRFNRRLSKGSTICFGENGSIKCNLEEGTYFDHEVKKGGGVLDFIKRYEGAAENKDAHKWLVDHRFVDPDTDQPRVRKNNGPRTIVAEYDYRDEAGQLLYQKVRLEPKTFMQRRKSFPSDPPEKIKRGDWVYNLEGVRLVLYRLREVLDAIADGRTIYLVNGEKAADRLWKEGIPATCSSLGEGKWSEEISGYLEENDVILIEDNDAAGRAHTDIVGAILQPVCASFRVLRLPDLPEKGDSFDWFEAGGTREKFFELAKGAEEWSPPPPEAPKPYISRHGAVPWSRMGQASEFEYEYLIEDLLPKEESFLVAGESQSGKTFTMMDIAVHGAGCEFNDELKIFHGLHVHPFGTVWCAGEKAKGAVLRMKAFQQHYSLPIGEDFPFVVLTQNLDIFGDERNVQSLIEEARDLTTHWKIPLGNVVVDTHDAMTPGASELDKKDISTIQKRYKMIREGLRATTSIIAHKNANGNIRGSLILFNAIETVLDISIPQDQAKRPFYDANGRIIRKAIIKKQSEGEAGKTWDFVVEQVKTGGMNRYGKPNTSCIVAAPQQNESTGGQGFGLKPKNMVLFKTLLVALIERGKPAPEGSRAPKNVRVVERSDWADVLERFEAPTETDEESRRAAIEKRIQRAINGFQQGDTHVKGWADRGLIGADTLKKNQIVWWTGSPVKGLSDYTEITGTMGEKYRVSDAAGPAERETMPELAQAPLPGNDTLPADLFQN